MRTYTINEAIEDIASTIQVFSDGYGTWKVKGFLGIRATGEYVEDYFITHDEEWKTGIFDGEKYNDYANSEQARQDSEENGENFDEWYAAVTRDSANEDNYESPDARNHRAAKKIVENWLDSYEWQNNVVVTTIKDKIFVLDEEESTFADENTDALGMLTDGRAKAFMNAFNSREEN